MLKLNTGSHRVFAVRDNRGLDQIVRYLQLQPDHKWVYIEAAWVAKLSALTTAKAHSVAKSD